MRIHMANLASKSQSDQQVVAETRANLEATTGGEHGVVQGCEHQSQLSGKTVLQMASECGADDPNRKLYQLAGDKLASGWLAASATASGGQ